LGKLLAEQPENVRARTLVERCQLQTLRLERLVQDLLDARRLQTGKFSLDIQPVRLDEIVARVAAMAQTMAPDQDHHLEIHLEAAETPVVINGDAGRLEQALMNLLTNAITYAPNTEQIDLRLARTDNEAEVSVRDYGPGIEPTELSHLTERFYQVTHLDADRISRRGLGLGLFIVSEIVAGHGGRLDMTSVVGEGTTFTIHLPLASDRDGDERLPAE
ncbi:MAG TPA: HAMP domain-containing sensor histidine kinase, partial [Ktedonobacterales bacterium]|nr:HAMP domain-containing sensor histidine kinase [Ktedonobacterales bacterium]